MKKMLNEIHQHPLKNHKRQEKVNPYKKTLDDLYVIKIRSSFARTHNFLLTAADKLTLNNSQILMLKIIKDKKK
jgi:hypothetical protein